MKSRQPLSRREFITHSSIAGFGTFILNSCSFTGPTPTLLVISGWQDINIGDIAHTPGLLHVLLTFLPKANIILWKKSRSEQVEKLLKAYFPSVKIIYGSVDENKNVNNPEVGEAFKKADIMIHGSGPHIVGKDYLQAWQKHTSKPFGIFGTTISYVNDELKELFAKSAFIYTRETKSIEVLRQNGISGDHISFGPDATFYMDIKNEEKGRRFLEANGLDKKSYICAIPRLRYTPYHKLKKDMNWSEEKIKEVEFTNEKYKEIDHAKLREAIIYWVRETNNKVLICPEMTYQVDIMDELLFDPLPDDVKPYIVKRGYWFPDEAAMVYQNAFAVLSFECHSPIIALTNGTPAFYLRQPEDTIKGQMYYDLGFEDWVFEIEETSGADIVDELSVVWQNYPASLETIRKSMSMVDEIYANSCQKIMQSISS